MKNWENIDYQTISKAHIRDGTLRVLFANGDQVDISLQSLIPFATEQALKNLQTDNPKVTPYEITIDLNSGLKVIPWDKIRVLTDKEFSRFMGEQAEEQAKLVGIKLKRLREKKSIKSNELAERSGITAQTISRIEKGHQDVSFTTLRKLLASMGYSLKDLANEEIEFEGEKAERKTLTVLLKRLSKIGIDPGFVTKRIIPKNIQNELKTFENEEPDLLLDEAASYLSNIYGWSVNDIWSNTNLSLDESSMNLSLFKKGVRSNDNQIKAYMPYANFLARATLKANNKTRSLPFPEDINEFRKILHDKYGGLNLDSILSYAWDMGVVVIPLKDSGIFHGAAWNIKGKHVIVLKQQVTSHAKWIFDLLHELYHVLVHLIEEDSIIIESHEISPISKDEDPKELEANSFANQVIFNGSAEQFAQEAVKLAKGKTEYLKVAVEDVASKHKIRVDALANYVAYRLAYQGSQWWQTADSLQMKEPEPYLVAREFLLNNMSMDKLSSLDYNILSNALNV
jgi:transcriptional regulator with XRE-family HTH domain/Zn-dependent peptidase ImmA (M78 family)